jgi:hypothetical protein
MGIVYIQCIEKAHRIAGEKAHCIGKIWFVAPPGAPVIKGYNAVPPRELGNLAKPYPRAPGEACYQKEVLAVPVNLLVDVDISDSYFGYILIEPSNDAVVRSPDHRYRAPAGCASIEHELASTGSRIPWSRHTSYTPLYLLGLVAARSASGVRICFRACHRWVYFHVHP